MHEKHDDLMFQKLGHKVDIKHLMDFIYRIGFGFMQIESAFPKNLKQNILVNVKQRIKFYEPCEAFEKYVKSLNEYETMFLLPPRLKRNLLEINECDDTIPIYRLAWSWNKVFDFQKKWTKKDINLQKRIFEYRTGQKDSDKTVDISSMSEKELLTKYYQQLLKKTNGKKQEAGKIAGIGKQIYQRIKKYNL